MKTNHGLLFIAGLSLLVLSAAPGLASAQTLDDAVKDLEGAARDLEGAAADLESAADALEASADSVQGIEAPEKDADGAMYSCSKHQRLIVNFKPEENKVVGDKNTKTVFKASGHCDVVIRNVTLRGDVVIDLSGHANVVFANVKVQGANIGIEISGHANVRLRNSSVVGKKAMLVSGHANVVLRNSTLTGKSTVSGFANVAYDKQSKVGKLGKSGRYATLRAL